MYRIAFNPELPVHAASSIHVGETVIAQDAPVDWRALGVSEQTLYDWWRAGLVYHPMPATEAQEGAVTASEPVVEQRLPGVASASVAEKLTRRERRALRNQG